jgi:hypothetical protein
MHDSVDLGEPGRLFAIPRMRRFCKLWVPHCNICVKMTQMLQCGAEGGKLGMLTHSYISYLSTAKFILKRIYIQAKLIKSQTYLIYINLVSLLLSSLGGKVI